MPCRCAPCDCHACPMRGMRPPTFDSRPRLLHALLHDRFQRRQPCEIELGVLSVIATLRYLEATVLHSRNHIMRGCGSGSRGARQRSKTPNTVPCPSTTRSPGLSKRRRRGRKKLLPCAQHGVLPAARRGRACRRRNSRPVYMVMARLGTVYAESGCQGGKHLVLPGTSSPEEPRSTSITLSSDNNNGGQKGREGHRIVQRKSQRLML